MNVHHLAALLVRIAGLILILKSLELVISLAMAGATNIVGQPGHVAFLTFHVMWFTAGVLFVMFPTRIAGNLVPAPAPDAESDDDIPADTLTRLILIAAGLYFLIEGIRDLVSFFSYWAVYMSQGFGDGLAKISFWQPRFVAQFVSGVVALGAGLILLLRPAGIASLIQQLRRSHPG